MTKLILRAAVLGVVAGLFGNAIEVRGAEGEGVATTRPAKDSTGVPVKVVALFSSGVGYFEHIGSVKDEATTELRFKTAQINDILKSLVLQDTGGKVSTIVYPSQDPVAKTLKSFQVDITSNPSLAELLNQLRGAKATITAGPQTLTGTVLGVEKRPKVTEKGPVDTWHVNILNEGTITQVALEDVSRVKLDDPELQEELNRALAALSQARDQDKKPVTINFSGKGDRLVRIGYVVETPIWKTSYRLLLGEEKATIQGWAIVENQTDNDWDNVQLSLVSGRPISFIQQLYQPLYIPRPVVQPELYASLRPQTYDEGLAQMPAGGVAGSGGQAERMSRAALRGATAAPAAPSNMAGRADSMVRERLESGSEMFNAPMDASASVASVASAARVGELFEYSVGSVSLPRQRSAMIPIITDPVEVERLSIYNQGVMARHPLNGARVKNTTKKHLLQGPVTVLQNGSYAGDASINNVPPGQERLLSFGIDLQTVVNASKTNETDAVLTGSIVKGVLYIKRKHVHTQEYVAENKDEKNKTLIVEHPLRQNWKLVETAKPIETTETLYRFKVEAPAGKSVSLAVKEEVVQTEAVEILPLDFGALDLYVRTGEIPKGVREALAKAAALKRAMAESQRIVQERKQQIAQATTDQQRIRENVKTVPDKLPYHAELIQRLQQKDKQIEGLFEQMEQVQKSMESQRKELENYLANLEIGEK